MPVNSTLVNTISSTVRILKDTVEYHWIVGCWPTAVANVIGYWDRNGFDNLIDGDSSYFSTAVKNSIASPEHYRDYYKEYLNLDPDASSSTKLDAHKNNSIADFVLTSRESEGLKDGWSSNSMVGVGLHGYATYRGYTNFETTQRAWGSYTFRNITDEIDAGRPVMLAIDTDANGATDHGVVVYGYDNTTQELIIHDGWSNTDELRRISFLPVQKGTEWGIERATFVRPPTSSVTNTIDPQFLHITNDGSNWASTYEGSLNRFGGLKAQLKSKNNNLSRYSMALASADGHTFYQLYNDGNGTAQLGRALYDGGGEFRWKSLNNDSGLSRNTIALATADAKTFYSLNDDGAGSAALYKSTLNADGTFSSLLLNKDSGASRTKTLGLSTIDGKTFYHPLDDDAGSAVMYELTLSSNNTFSFSLLNSDSGISRSALAQAAWITPDINNSPKPVLGGATKTGTTSNDTLRGTSYNDSLTGNDGNDELFGYGGDDTLNGGKGNDNVIAGGGNDVINGTDVTSRGRFEQDYIDVGSGKDTVLLGDETGSYYTANGWEDSVYIDNFEAGKDKLVLFGNADLYITDSSADGTYILYGQDYRTAIAYLNGVSSFDLTDSTVSFVGDVPPEPVTPEPITPEPVTPPAEPTTYNGITGTVDNDNLLGTGGADRLVGLNGIDYAYGGGGSDRFVLGDASGSFYTQSQWDDYVYIDDFKVGTDQLELYGSVGDYSVVSDEQGTWLYAGGAGTEPIAYLNQVSNLQLSSLDYLS